MYFVNEQQLLIICLVVTSIGLAGLLFIEDIHSSEQYARLVWAENNTGLLVYEQTIWVQTQTPILLATNQCVRVTGVIQEDRISHALIGPADESNCGF